MRGKVLSGLSIDSPPAPHLTDKLLYENSDYEKRIEVMKNVTIEVVYIAYVLDGTVIL